MIHQTHPFRGMFPRKRTKQRVEAEVDEDRMVSRLQLDLGRSLLFILEAVWRSLLYKEREDLAKRVLKREDKSGAVNVFRGVSFDDWLRIFMQVGNIYQISRVFGYQYDSTLSS